MHLKLHWQILIALALAIAIGLAAGSESGIGDLRWVAVFDFIGTLFLNALKMLIVPLVMSSIITGIVGVGQIGGLGKLGGKTVLYYLSTSLIAIFIGLGFVNAITPGIVDGHAAGGALGLSAEGTAAAAKVGDRGMADVVEVFLRMIPTNIVAAAAEGQMLGLIFFSLLFGYFMTQLARPQGDVLAQFWQAVLDVMMRITDLVMKFAPLGVFGLVASVVAKTGLEAFQSLGLFFGTVLLALAAHFLIALPLILRFLAGVNPWRHYRAMAPALLTAFSTSSSSATLPVSLDCLEKNAGVSNRVGSFVLPLGATINMDGTALYECVAVMFIAQAYGVELSLAQQLIVVFLALATSIGVAGIPSASLVAIVVILGAVGLPAEGIGLILAVDRLLDMCRTSVNVFSDACGAVVIARSEGETQILTGPIDRRV